MLTKITYRHLQKSGRTSWTNQHNRERQLPLSFGVTMLELILNVKDNKHVWELDGLPVSICISGTSHYVSAHDVRIEHFIGQDPKPGGDRNTYIFKSADGKSIDDISLVQSWRRPGAISRYESHSFPLVECVKLPNDASILSCLAVSRLIDVAKGHYVTTPMLEYLEETNQLVKVSV